MTMAAVLLLCLAAALGLFLGLGYFKGQRNKPVLVGVHLLLGIGGTEALLLTHRSISGDEAATGGTGALPALGLLAAAIFMGFVAPMIGRNARPAGTMALATHAVLAACGVGLTLFWVLSL